MANGMFFWPLWLKTMQMKTLKFFLPVVVLSAVYISCSTPAYVQKDDNVRLENYKTYMWVETRSGEDDKSDRASAYADIGVRNAVNPELGKWGWMETSENPDVFVTYDVLVERTVETNREAVYSQPFTRTVYNPYTRRWFSVYYPSAFQGYDVYQTPVREATITVTLIDAKTEKNIWQGWTTERLTGSRLSETEIDKSIRNIFRQ
jgi:hypothetical protein